MTISCPKIRTWRGNERNNPQLMLYCASCRQSFKFGFSNSPLSNVSIRNNSEGSEASSDSGTMNYSQISSKPKRVRDKFRAWNFYYTIQTDLLEEEGICTDEKKLLLTKHLQFVWVIIDRRRSPSSGPSLSRYYGILQFFFGHDLFTRYAPSDFGPCRRLHPVSEQQSTHDDPLVP